MITLQKSQVWVNINADSKHVDAQGQIPVYLTKKDAQANALLVGWNKSDVQKVAIDKGVCRQGWAIVNSVANEYHVFKVGRTVEVYNW